MTEEKLVPSRNSLFKGQMVRKPSRALVVGHDPAGGAIYACPKCSHRSTIEDCDAGGAEPGCFFCNNCNAEFEA